MSELSYSRIEDQSPVSAEQKKPVQLSSILGVWTNTNPLGRGIESFVVSEKREQAYLRVYGSGASSAVDWGEVPVSVVYAKSSHSSEPMAFEARYDLGFMDIHIQANFSLGLLVMACFNCFKDGSGRSNYFSREFFHRETTQRVS